MGRQSQLQACPDLILKGCQPFVFKTNTGNCLQAAGDTRALVLDPGGSGLESQTLSPLSSFTKPLQPPLVMAGPTEASRAGLSHRKWSAVLRGAVCLSPWAHRFILGSHPPRCKPVLCFSQIQCLRLFRYLR